MQKILVYIAVVCLTVVLSYNEKGSPCTVRKDGSNGTCQYLQDCKSVRKDLNFVSLPQICSYENTRLIVCCQQVIHSPLSENPETYGAGKRNSSKRMSIPDKKEGSPCTIEKDGSNGTCQYLQDCNSVKKDLDFESLPQMCSHEKTQLLVCCQQVISSPVTERPETSTAGTRNLTKTIITQEKAEDCTYEKDGSSGTCKYLEDCDSIKEDLDSERLPQTCSYNGSRLIVCCKSVSSANILVPEIQEIIEVNQLDSSGLKVGLKSKEKCKEYAKYVYEDTTKKSMCTFDRESLISGGTEAGIGEFPHMALVGYNSNKNGDIAWECGGSLISEDFVLTAAHCVLHRAYGEAKHVILGISNRTEISKGITIEIVQIIQFPKYIAKYHDIALLKLAQKVKFSSLVRPACLYTLSPTPTERAIASGWGLTRDVNDGGAVSEDLRKVVLDIYDAIQCNKTYRSLIASIDSSLKDGILDEFMVCAGSKTQEDKDACQGDSGGPLQIYHTDEEDIQCMYDIIGVTAFGRGCGLSTDNPGIYTRVARYINWIESMVWP